MTLITEEEDAELRRIRSNLAQLLQQYHDILNPGQIILDWVILSQRSSVELERTGRKAVGIMAAEGQSFITTRGLLEYGIEIERADFTMSFTRRRED